jgi:hypothetical protein
MAPCVGLRVSVWERRLTDVADALAKGLLHGEHLVHDLVRRQVAREAAGAGRTEAAAHGAAHLQGGGGGTHQRTRARDRDRKPPGGQATREACSLAWSPPQSRKH